MKRPDAVLPLLLVLLLPAEARPQAATPAEARPQAATAAAAAESPAVRAFRERLDRYVAMRRAQEERLPPLDGTQTDMRLVQQHADTLAAAIQRARAGARQGDLFIPEIRPLLLGAARDVFTHDPAARSATRDGNPVFEGLRGHKCRVNAVYPEPAPFSTVPSALLERLPQLPDDLEYRFHGRDLLLVDTKTRLVLDILPGAAPQ